MANVVEAKASGGQWNHDLLAHMLAPEIADFTEADVSALAIEFEQGDHWITNFFLNSVFGTNFGGKWRVYVLNLIFRSQNSLREYEHAADLTAKFLQHTRPGNPPIQTYFKALSAWECSFLNFSIALDVFKKMNRDIGAFVQNDGSVDERAYYFANVTKHYAGEVANHPEIPNSSELLPSDPLEPHAIPVWLTNDGFASAKKMLSYAEYAHAVKELCGLADQLTNPAKWVEDMKRKRAESAT